MNMLQLPASLRQTLLTASILDINTRRFASTLQAQRQKSESYEASPSDSVRKPSGIDTFTLNSYTVSLPPKRSQLKYSESYFRSSPPSIIYSADTFRSLPPSSVPEVAFLGRSNVGKSSMLNALFGRSRVTSDISLAHVSKTPGRTRTMNGFAVLGHNATTSASDKGPAETSWKRLPRGSCIIVDMPGYGSGSREQWGKEIIKYLERRKQLRRAFVLIDAEHGLKNSDSQLLLHLRRQGIPHQIVLNKVDKLLTRGSKAPSQQRLSAGMAQARDVWTRMMGALEADDSHGQSHAMDMLCCSAIKGLDPNTHHKIGIDELRWAILSACGLNDLGATRKALTADVQILENDS